MLAVAIAACSLYANLSFAVSNSADYRYFPPFRPHVNANSNSHLGGEYFNIAQALVRGEGFAHPFDRPTGPTAWQPPVLPILLAGLLWICAGSRHAVMTVVIFLQVEVLIVTGLLVLALAQQVVGPRATVWAAVLFFAALLCEFRLCFQTTHDSWLVLLAMDGLLFGLWRLRPLLRSRSAAVWGVFGGLCAMINPVVGFVWGACSLAVGFRERAWHSIAVAVLIAGLLLAPWMVRNYLVFGRLIPTKANLAYELYQSQCLQPGGLIQDATFARHPYIRTTSERREYNVLGETAYLDRKGEQFCQSVGSDPAGFVRRVLDRLLGATFRYVPFDRAEASKRPWVFWLSRLTHPLPIVGFLVLLLIAIKNRLQKMQWIVIGVYLLYLFPYVLVSYYERYGFPLIALKVLLVLCAMDRLFRFQGKMVNTRRRPSSAVGAALPGPCKAACGVPGPG
jgi:hypothetical protein